MCSSSTRAAHAVAVGAVVDTASFLSAATASAGHGHVVLHIGLLALATKEILERVHGVEVR